MSRSVREPEPGTVIRIAMGEGRVAQSPDIMISEGLGSCVAVVLYDASRRTGGMAHVMLPSSAPSALHPFWSADRAVRALMREMRRRGSLGADVGAKIAGGARLFPAYSGFSVGIGAENVKSVRESLDRAGIRLIGSDVGGTHGRSVVVHLDTGRVVVKAFGMEDREI